MEVGFCLGGGQILSHVAEQRLGQALLANGVQRSSRLPSRVSSSLPVPGHAGRATGQASNDGGRVHGWAKMSVSVSVSLPASAEHVGVVRDLVASGLRRFRAPDEVISDMELVVSEASGNVVRHTIGELAYRVTVELGEGRCAVIVTSQGTQFGLSPGMPVAGAESGRGMALMGALTDTISVEQEAGHTSVVMTRNW